MSICTYMQCSCFGTILLFRFTNETCRNKLLVYRSKVEVKIIWKYFFHIFCDSHHGSFVKQPYVQFALIFQSMSKFDICLKARHLRLQVWIWLGKSRKIYTYHKSKVSLAYVFWAATSKWLTRSSPNLHIYNSLIKSTSCTMYMYM